MRRFSDKVQLVQVAKNNHWRRINWRINSHCADVPDVVINICYAGMKLPWSKKSQRSTDQAPPVVRPPTKRPITEFEIRRLEEKGVWISIQIQVTPKGSWVNWNHDIPEELRQEARDALVALVLQLQDK